MDIIISASALSGTVDIPASKSFAHRQLIAAALADQSTTIQMNARSADIDATASCINAMGADAALLSNNTGYIVSPIAKIPDEASLFCCESGSTLRFLLPVAAALGIRAAFTGTGRLPQRPNQVLIDQMRSHGITADSDYLPLAISGTLQSGLYEIAGNVSSQYITGLLLALPLLPGNSQIRFTTPLESAAYLNITCAVLHQFGIRVERTPDGYLIPGNQSYLSPVNITTEGDWSSAVFWHCANRMGHRITITGLNNTSCQGDKSVLQQLQGLGSEIDVSQTPDSLPALAVTACTFPGITRFTGAGRLRIKESDRLKAVADMLTALGQKVQEHPEGITVYGGAPFTGGRVNGCNDHRIVMAAALAASLSQSPVTITDAEAVRKSYPAFFKDFAALGGNIHGQYPG